MGGKLIAAIEEERLRHVKHWTGYPAQSIQVYLGEVGLLIDDIDCIAINRTVEFLVKVVKSNKNWTYE